jgi:hypothetical protein
VLKVLLRSSVFVVAAFLGFSPHPANALWNGHPLSESRASSSFTVLLRISGKKQLDCSGVMIAPRLVLTAGHCLLGASRVSVRIGSETIGAENWLVNPSWSAGLPAEGWDSHIDSSNSDNYVDLALLLLSHAPEHGRPILIADDMAPQSSLKTYGYARSMMLEPLYKIDVSSASLLQRLSPRGPFKLYASGGSAWCQGDSGGPITRSSADGEKLVGIVGLGLGAIEHEPTSALAMRWGGPERVPKCGAYAYVQDVQLHADWIMQASRALIGDVPFTSSTSGEDR